MRYLVLLLVLLAGCVEPAPKPVRLPRQPSLQPVEYPNLEMIVMITRDGCVYCDKQKRVFGEMRLVDGRDVLILNHSLGEGRDFEAPAYPMLYVYFKDNPRPQWFLGFHDRSQLEAIIRQ